MIKHNPYFFGMNHPNTGTILNDMEWLKQHVRGSMPKQSIDYYENTDSS
jgi:hypothetical protein